MVTDITSALSFFTDHAEMIVGGTDTAQQVADLTEECLDHSHPAKKPSELVRDPHYRALLIVQDIAKPLEKPRKWLSRLDCLSAPMQFLANIFKGMDKYSWFSKAIAFSSTAIFMLIVGSICAAISFVCSIYNTYKAVIFNRKINELTTAINSFDNDNRITSIGEIQALTAYDRCRKILSLQRNKAIRNVFLSLGVVALFIASNLLTFGIPLIVATALLLILTIIKICYDIKAHSEIKNLRQELEELTIPDPQEFDILSPRTQNRYKEIMKNDLAIIAHESSDSCERTFDLISAL